MGYALRCQTLWYGVMAWAMNRCLCVGRYYYPRCLCCTYIFQYLSTGSVMSPVVLQLSNVIINCNKHLFMLLLFFVQAVDFNIFEGMVCHGAPSVVITQGTVVLQNDKVRVQDRSCISVRI